MKLRIPTLLVFILSVGNLVSSACTQVFSALSINGVQHPLQSSENYPPPVVSGVIPLDVQFRSVGESVMAVNGVSLLYTVDNQPVGPVLTNNFAWSLNTATIPDGTHSLSVLYVNEPAPASVCYTFLGRQYAFVVSNSGKAITGPQLLPVISPPPGYGPVAPQEADFITYAGYQPHAASNPFPYQYIPPAGGITPTDFWIEPLLASLSNTGEAVPAIGN